MNMRKFRVMKKIIVLLCTTLYSLGFASAQISSEVPLDRYEKWWGLYTSLGDEMPYVEAVEQLNLWKTSNGNQVSPVLVSSLGRYIYCEEPFEWSFDGKSLYFSAPVQLEAEKVGRNLREAFVVAANRHLKPSGHLPADIFFTAPQYNTWIEMLYDQNQEGVLNYARKVVENGLPPGVLMIDDNWQADYGAYSFRGEQFPDPKAMVDELHSLGFRVMLWITPFVSADGQPFRELRDKGFLIKNSNNKPKIVEWWNGHSAMLNLADTSAVKWLKSELVALQDKYGIDGFKFDGGDFEYYEGQGSTAQIKAWQQLATEFAFSELRVAWGGGAQRVVQRLRDKDHSWEALQTLVPHITAAGLLGYPYVCPDMIGGGQYTSFSGVTEENFNQELFVRWAQASALMPMMQFSIAPWRMLSPENMEIVKAAVKLHTELSPYIMELAREASETGEPIVRHMEYNFPKAGFADCHDQFMLGTKYLVAPILKSGTKRVVRLPRGRWVDDQGKTFRGPLVMEITAELTRLPYYTKK